MKELFINVINNGDYSLRDMLKKINERHINNDLTDEEKVELEEMARNNAKAINDYAPIEERLEEAFRRIEALESKNQSFEEWKEWLLKNSNIEIYYQEDNEEPSEEEVVEEYPEYVKPTGGHDAHMKGYKTTYKGKKFISLIDNNVWAPDEYPQGWKEVVEVKEVE